MHLIQLLLPLYDNHGKPFGQASFDQVRNELSDQFGGVTAWRRSPAEGVWQKEDGGTSRDEIVIFEVMVDFLDRNWWRDYRLELQRRFRQEQLIVRAQQIDPL
jgi:hypothetical protein